MTAERWYASILRPAALIGAIGVASKLLQAAVAVLVAYKLGAGIATDAYFIAKSLPIAVYLVADSLLYNSFVPLYRRPGGDAEPGSRLLGALTSYAAGAAILVAGGLIAAAPMIPRLLAPGSTAATAALAVDLSRLTALALLAAIPASLLKALNVCHGRYVLASLDALVMHTVLIAALVLGPSAWGVWPVAAALPVAFAVLAGLQVIAGRHDLARPRLGVPRAEFLDFGALVTPLLAVNAVQQVNALIMNGAASFTGTGAISHMTYSYNLAQAPVSVADLVLMSAFFPFAARLAAEHDKDTFRMAFGSALRLLVAGLVPFTVWLLFARHEIVRVALRHGRFGGPDAAATAQCLIGHALAIAPWAVETLSYRSLFALRRHWRAFQVIALRVAANAALCVVLVPLFGLPGVSLAFAVSYALAAALGVWFVRREILGEASNTGARPTRPWLVSTAVAAAATGACCIGIRHAMPVPATFWRAAGYLLASGGVCAGMVLVLYLQWWKPSSAPTEDGARSRMP